MAQDIKSAGGDAPAPATAELVKTIAVHLEECQVCAPDRLIFCEVAVPLVLRVGSKLDKAVDDIVDGWKRKLLQALVGRVRRRPW